ncbi:TlpA disulfide reductase family protein [Micromonospora sp. CPCC 205539]|uniref:TlpA family protein disulfide reductase n=1 Tax=Micromonospora sp. CPCC 205539 TaxID=3122408 RepID=UPI002FEF4DC3
METKPMLYLTAAVVILTLLTLFNLMLMLGVVRRLRDHTGRFAEMTRSVMPDVPVLARGRAVPAFSAATRDGGQFTTESLDGDTLVGFFSPSCAPCQALAPRFAEYAERFPGGRDRVLAVVAEDADPAVYVKMFAPVARIVVEEPGGPVATAFEVSGFPALCLIAADGTVAVSGMRMEDLPASRPLVAHG